MDIKVISIKSYGQNSIYPITIGAELANAGYRIREIAGPGSKLAAIISNPKIFRLYGESLSNSLRQVGFEVAAWEMRDGERYKNLRSLESALEFLSGKRLTRSDTIIALGGGVVGDLAGFAASVYLRGISFIQVPTTLLSMIDSSVGGKTGLNTHFGKNLVGSFYQPRGVLIDEGTLSTLPVRELTAGFCEAVKHAALSGPKLLAQTSDFLNAYPTTELSKRISKEKVRKELIGLIGENVSFKAKIVRQDPTESLDRRDAKSRKILNFGHTFAHALEMVTNYRYFRHGEAVGYGILFAAELSKKLELIDENELQCLNDVVRRAGSLPTLDHIDGNALLEAFEFDKKQVSGSLQWVLLKGIGNPIILSGKDVPASAVKHALKKVLR